MKRRTTIVEIAESLGISPSTVSRAFNKPNLLLPETVERVRAKAAELGYVANEHARALITGRSGAIGFIVPDITNPFFPPMLRAAQRAAEQTGKGVLIADTDYDPRREREMIERLVPRSEGLVLASSRLPEEELIKLADQLPVVLVNREVEVLNRVLLTSHAALTQAMKDFHNAGHRRMVYVGGPEASWSESERASTFAGAAQSYGIDYECLRAPDGLYQQARDLAKLIAQGSSTAVVAFDDVLGHGVLDGLHAAGKRVPEEIALLGCDDALPIGAGRRLSTITIPTAEAAVQAVRLLDEPWGETPSCIDIPGTLHHRETT